MHKDNVSNALQSSHSVLLARVPPSARHVHPITTFNRIHNALSAPQQDAAFVQAVFAQPAKQGTLA